MLHRLLIQTRGTAKETFVVSWTSEWYDADGYDDGSQTDDHDPNDSTFSDLYPALLDQTVETQEGDTSKLESLQEAVGANMSRRTWTQTR